MWGASGQTPQMRLVNVGISSTGRPTQKRSKPRSSGIWKYALATSPSGSRKISILPWPSSLVTGSIVIRSISRLLPAVLPGRAAAAQQRTRQAEAVELAHRVGDAVEHFVDLLGLGCIDHRGEGRHQAGAVVDPAPSRAVAADARGRDGRAQGAAAVAGRGAVAGQALLEEADLRVETGDLLDADELVDLLDVALAGALAADRRGSGAKDRALWRKRSGAVESLDHGLECRPDLDGLGRAAGDRVVHVHDLVEGPQDGLERGQVGSEEHTSE